MLQLASFGVVWISGGCTGAQCMCWPCTIAAVSEVESRRSKRYDELTSMVSSMVKTHCSTLLRFGEGPSSQYKPSWFSFEAPLAIMFNLGLVSSSSSDEALSCSSMGGHSFESDFDEVTRSSTPWIVVCMSCHLMISFGFLGSFYDKC